MLIVLSVLVIGVLIKETYFDKKKWANGESDKPISTIIRIGAISAFSVGVAVLFSTPIWLTLLYGLTLQQGLFDFILNVSRWGVLPNAYDYRVAHGFHMTKWQNRWFRFRCFLAKFFYHGDEKTKNWWDLAFQRIPPPMELLLKFGAIALSIWLLL
jgi:hypothetical protein